MQLTGIGSEWRKSARCGPDNGCVELARLNIDASGQIGVRDSKNISASPVLSFERDVWAGFTLRIKAGSYDLP